MLFNKYIIISRVIISYHGVVFFKAYKKKSFVKMFSGMTFFFFDFFSGKVSSLLIQNVENSIHPLCHCSWNSCGSIDYGTLWFLARSTSFLFWRTEHLESVSPIYHPSAFIIVPEKEPAVSSSFSLFLLEMDIYIVLLK